MFSGHRAERQGEGGWLFPLEFQSDPFENGTTVVLWTVLFVPDPLAAPVRDGLVAIQTAAQERRRKYAEERAKLETETAAAA